jgi:phosphoesterase RecJ-like protein
MVEFAARLAETVETSRSVLLTGPEGPDGDSIGACLALQRLLARKFPDVRVDVAGTPGSRYAWMPGAERMVPDADVGAYDGVVVLDGDRHRLYPEVARAFAGARWRGIIDHHRSTELEGYELVYFAPSAESTCGMIAALAKEWSVPFDRALAEQLYAGLVFDTGGFRYSNATAATLRLAAELLETGIDHARIMLKVLVERRQSSIRLLARLLGDAHFSADGRLAFTVCTRDHLAAAGATEADLEGVVDHLQHVEGVDLAVVVVERGPERVKLSLRSSGRVDVATLARSLDAGGGGHAKAAGVQLKASVGAVSARLVPELTARVAAL